MRIESLDVEDDMEGERLDIFIAGTLEGLSRSQVKALIDTEKVKVDNQIRKASYRLKAGEEIKIVIPEFREVKLIAQDIPLEIIYEDQDLVVINKPKNMVVHPAHGNTENTLVNALLFHVKELSSINGATRPGIVHRLDKDTSGVMVVAKNDNAHQHLAAQFKEQKVTREYIALVHGIIKENLGIIDAPIGRSKTDRKKMAVIKEGRKAISEYRILERFSDYTLVQVKLITGRTHQIRVHFSYIKHSVVGDQMYGPRRKHFNLDSQALHAELLGFVHPTRGKYMEFRSLTPNYMENILFELRKINIDMDRHID
ncbi:MAG TPA: RluA family pseudouridine synthase [Syntrophomonadaceae bacterium]|nr:RluA family pseudouridine synthase [Syntrophomonadaceae bacterium]